MFPYREMVSMTFDPKHKALMGGIFVLNGGGRSDFLSNPMEISVLVSSF